MLNIPTPNGCSLMEGLSLLPYQERQEKLKQLNLTDEQFFDSRDKAWYLLRRKKQTPPEGNWSVWVLRAGRGFGKTKCGSGWINQRALEHSGRWMALVARTPADARDVMIEGPSGILRNCLPEDKPNYEPSKRRITWPNGSWATVYSDEEPDQLRGFSGDTAWFDELGKMIHPQESWDNLMFGMREISADRPRTLITTTPRPIPILKAIERLPGSVTVIGSSYENRRNLDKDWVKQVLGQYEGTRLGRQEIHAEILDDVPGALWTRAMLDAAIHRGPLPDMTRVVVGVDPSGSSGNEDEGGNSIGIVTMGIGVDGIGYVLADNTCCLSPHGWGRRVVDAYHRHSADRIVAERNYGGAMVEYVIRSVEVNVPIRMVTASRGKVQRAEPVAALYEKGSIKHPLVDVYGNKTNLAKLEDQLCAFTSDGYVGEGSPDIADAAIWAATDLMFKRFQPMVSIGLPKVFA